MAKRLLIGCAVFVLIGLVGVAGLGWWAYRTMTGPMYVPGGLAGSQGLEPPAQPVGDGPWLVERDVSLHRFARGTGRPILFVHGGPGFPTRAPMAWLEALADGEINFYDQRGCGASTRPFDRFEGPNVWTNMKQLEGKLGLGAQIADIERIRRILGEEKLILVGHSFGGFQAALYATEFPERVEKLILLAPADLLAMPVADEGMFGLVRKGLPEAERARYDAFLEDYLNFGDLFSRDEGELARTNIRLGNYILQAMGLAPQPVPAPGAETTAGGWMVYAMYLSMGQHHDYREAMARITTPTLIVHGTGDLDPGRAAGEYARLISGAEVLPIEGAGHFFEGEQDELSVAVIEFLGRQRVDEPIPILHLDRDLVVISKPPGMNVHREARSRRDERFVLQTVSHQIGGFLYPVHRLDRNTSGVMSFALSRAMARNLQENLGADDAHKEYLVLVRGRTPLAFVSDRPLTSERGNRQLARTEFRRLAEFSRCSLLSARISTGRRHQIRRHLGHLAHQVIGDTSYGKGRINAWLRENHGLPRMFLHAARLVVAHPRTGECLDYRDPLAEDLRSFLGRLPDVDPDLLARL